MRISEGPSVISKRALSPRKDEGENVSGDELRVQYKEAKFKSPLSVRTTHRFQASQSSEQIATEECDTKHTMLSGNGVVSGPELKAEISTNGRKRAFGTDSSNIQPLVENSNQEATKKPKRSFDYQENGMPSFGGILEEVYKIRAEVGVQIKLSDGMSSQQKNSPLQSACKAREADNTDAHREKPTGSTLERNADSNVDEISCDLRSEKRRLGAGSCRSLGAANKGSINSKFKMPSRVVSGFRVVKGFKAPDASEISRNGPDSLSRPQSFITPYRPSTPMHSGNANESRWKVEEPIQSDYYCVMYCVRKPKAKHKGPWFDGILLRRGRSSVLQDTERKVVSNDCEQRGGALLDGATLFMGKFEVEVMGRSTEDEFLDGKKLLGAIDVPRDAIAKVIQKRPFKRFQAPPVKQARVSTDAEVVAPLEVRTAEGKPTLRKDDLVLNAMDLQGAGVPVIVDPYLALKLRPHQRDGVKFMYECVMGLRNSSFTGCLLADAMGLGKTLQVIALVWTLIKQGPGGHPAVRRVLVICPSSLVENWGKEVRKWLGDERLIPLIIHSGTSAKDVKRKLSSFQVGTIYHLLITSYELLRKYKDDLKSAKPGLLVCDEAHRLKNCAGNKTIDSLLELNCSKKLILTGTPVQNDLLEFYAMIDFVNPQLLGPLSMFKRLYANPIEKSRDRDASEKDKIMGRARSTELQSMTRFCILQRAANVNSKYLPAKTEFVVFCKLQPLQVSLYQNFLTSKLVRESLASGQSAFVLSAIGTLRKLCNHPKLVEHELNKGNENINGVLSKRGDVPTALSEQSYRRQERTSADWRLSGKLSCLQRLLAAVHESSGTSDKMVVVSNFTQTLDIIQTLCDGHGWRWLRLDGATNVSERQALVDKFNTAENKESVFLLSSKAGGSGLNLVGASRLVLFDPDWNPATDAQAMARVWRDGQKKAVFIYRLLTTASIEEKIYQRQIMKGEVAAAVEKQAEVQFAGGDGGGRRHFSREELRELFTLDLETSCDTYDLLSQSESSRSENWRDYSKDVEDHALKEAIQTGVVTFVYQNIYKKDVISSLGNAHDVVENPMLEEKAVGVDSNQPSSHLSSGVFNGEVDEVPPDFGQEIANSKRENNAEENWEAKKHDLSSGPSNVFVDEMDDLLLKCDNRIGSPVHQDILGPEDERLPANSSRSTISTSENNAMRDAEKHAFSSVACKISSEEIDELLLDLDEQIANPICRENNTMVGLKYERRKDSSSTVSERENSGREIWDAKKDDVYGDVIDRLELESDERIASKPHIEHESISALEDERLAANNSSSSLSKMKIKVEVNSDVQYDVDTDTKPAESSPMPFHVARTFDCLLESKGQKILGLLVDSPVPDDDCDIDELEVLDAPFLCTLDLEMEMKKVSFAAEDLWQGFKLFAVGFLLGTEEQKLVYRKSKLGLVLNKCNLHETTDDESIFCKGVPLVRSVLGRRNGHQAADISHLFNQYEREEHLLTTSSGRFMIDLMRQFNAVQAKRDGLA